MSERHVELWRCSRCGMLRLPDGCEEEDGPPECDHGLFFGTGPDGGGETEMELVKLVPASDLEAAASLFDWIRDNHPKALVEAPRELLDRLKQ